MSSAFSATTTPSGTPLPATISLHAKKTTQWLRRPLPAAVAVAVGLAAGLLWWNGGAESDVPASGDASAKGQPAAHVSESTDRGETEAHGAADNTAANEAESPTEVDSAEPEQPAGAGPELGQDAGASPSNGAREHGPTPAPNSGFVPTHRKRRPRKPDIYEGY